MDILQKQRDYYLMRFLAETKERIPTRRYDELHSCWLGSFQVDILFFFMTFLEKWLSRIPKDRNLLDDTTPPTFLIHHVLKRWLMYESSLTCHIGSAHRDQC